MNAAPDPFKPINDPRRCPHRDGHPVRSRRRAGRGGRGGADPPPAGNGSDGVVLAGTTGEGSTVTDDEDVALWELGVEVARRRHGHRRHRHQRHPPLDRADRAGRRLRRGRRAGGHALLQPPQPGRPAGPLPRRCRRHRPADRALQHPAPHGPDMPNDLLAELAPDPQHRRGQAGPLRGPGADRRPGPAVRQRRRAAPRSGHGRHRRHPGGLAPGRRRRCAAWSTSPTTGDEIQERSSRCTRRCRWPRWRRR